MTYALACVGDKTDHGGQIISGNATFDMDGRKLAQVGDLTVCPKCKGTFAITTGTDNFAVDGRQAAIHGSKTACGATIIAKQTNTTWATSEGEAGHSSGALAALVPEAAAATAPTICLECLIHAAESGASTVVRT